MGNTTCYVCRTETLEPEVSDYLASYKNAQKTLKLHGKFCKNCGIAFTDQPDMLYNKRLMIAFRKEVDGLLTGSEIKAFRARRHLTQLAAAKLFGGGPKAFSKYETDDIVQSEVMDSLLRLCIENETALQTLANIKGVQLKVPAPKQHAEQQDVQSTFDIPIDESLGEILERSTPLYKIVINLNKKPEKRFTKSKTTSYGTFDTNGASANIASNDYRIEDEAQPLTA